MNRKQSWTEQWEHEGHKLNASSDNKYLYLTVANSSSQPREGTTMTMTASQIISLQEMLEEAIHSLREDGRWPTDSK